MSRPNAPNPKPKPWRSLRHVMKTKGMTINELAESAGLSKSYVDHLLAGSRNPSSRTVKRLATALDVPVEHLRADFAANPGSVEQLQQLREQAAVLAEQIDTLAAHLPDPRTSKATQEVA